jgi:hypothetical protein
MPIPIPIYERKEQIIPGASSALMPTETPADIRAMQNLGATGMNVGNQITAAAQNMQERKNADDLIRLKIKHLSQIREMSIKFQEAMSKGGDPYGADQEWDFAVGKLTEESLKDINPSIANKADLEIQEINSQYKNHTALIQAEAQIKYDQQSKEQLIMEYGKEAAVYADSPALVDQAIEKGISDLKVFYPNKAIPEIIKTKSVAHMASNAFQAAIATENVESAKYILAKYGPEFKATGIFDELHSRLEGAEKDMNLNSSFNEALAMGTVNGYVDYSKASAWLFSAEAREKYKLTPAMVSANIRSLGDKQVAEQGTIMNGLYAQASTPNGASKTIRDISQLMKNPRGMDAQQFLSLKMSLEAGERAKISAARQDNLMDEQYKATISTNISLGIYKDENEIRNAVLSAGLRKPAGYMETAVGQFRDFQKQYGAVNNFKEGEEYIDTKIRQAPKAMRGDYATKKTEIMNEVNKRLIAEKIPITDPRAQKYLKEAWDEHTKTWMGKIWNSVNPFGKPSTAKEPVSINAPLQGKQIAKTRTEPNGDILILYTDGTTSIKPNPRRKR